MKRDEATRRIAELLVRVSAGGNVYRDAVEEVSVFGSYAAGALAPNDVDLAVRYDDATSQIAEEQLKRMSEGMNAETPFSQALRGRRRGVNIAFNKRDVFERQGFIFVTLWKRGDSLEAALERLHAIAPDPTTRSAPRDHVHPVIAGFEKQIPIDARRQLIELHEHGQVELRRFDLARDLEPVDDELRRLAGWGYSDSSPRRQAMRALLSHLEAEGVPVEGSQREVILSHDLPDGPFGTVQHGAERLGGALYDAVSRRSGRSYCVLNLTGTDPFAVLEIRARQPVVGGEERG